MEEGDRKGAFAGEGAGNEAIPRSRHCEPQRSNPSIPSLRAAAKQSLDPVIASRGEAIQRFFSGLPRAK
jgi:hypothetical protein